MQIVSKTIAEYTESFTTGEPDTVKALIRESEENLNYTDMLSGRQTGMLLKLLVGISGARRVLEVGTFTGYSALMMADALPDDGELITCEKNEHFTAVSGRFFSKEPYKRKIRQVLGDALQTIPGIEGPFDLIFLDADKINYPAYYKLAKEKTRKGGIIVADNTLWGGGVLTEADEKAKAIHRFNEMVRDDEDVEQVMLPVRDGVLIVRMK